jgi:hypothetical protein
MVKLISMLIFSLSLCSAYAGELGTSSQNGRARKEIIVRDPLKPHTRSGDLIRLVQSDSQLETYFDIPLGLTQISVLDDSGICVYQTIVDTNTDKHTVIDLSLCNEGNYKIIFTTEKNLFVGYFQL